MNCNGFSQQQSQPRHESLLVDWPRHNSSKEADPDAQPKTTPKVSFSDTSTLFVYNDVDYLHQKMKAYNDGELHTFEVKAMTDVHKIKLLIVGCQQNSVVESIMFLVKNDIITRDELVGLDHLILGTSSSVMQVRGHDHMSAVLRKQHEQQRFTLRSKFDVEEEFDPVMDLAKCAQRSSLCSRDQGIVRAKLSSLCIRTPESDCWRASHLRH